MGSPFLRPHFSFDRPFNLLTWRVCTLSLTPASRVLGRGICRSSHLVSRKFDLFTLWYYVTWGRLVICFRFWNFLEGPEPTRTSVHKYIFFRRAGTEKNKCRSRRICGSSVSRRCCTYGCVLGRRVGRVKFCGSLTSLSAVRKPWTARAVPGTVRLVFAAMIMEWICRNGTAAELKSSY
jgi:hypothetical protein